jgi:hypothetical protein
MNMIDRLQAATPPFFKKIRNIGIILATVSATLLAAPIALPAVVLQLAGYMAVAGTVATAISQTTISDQSVDKGDSHAN